MRRLGPHVFKVCAATALVLLVALCVLWVRSPGTRDGVNVYTPDASHTLMTVPHCVEVSSLTSRSPQSYGWSTSSVPRQSRGYRIWWVPPASHHLGFGWESRTLGPQVRFVRLVVPFWFLAAALAVMPAVAARRAVRRRSRIARNCCPACGYDLRASPDYCPECATPPPTPPTPAEARRKRIIGVVLVALLVATTGLVAYRRWAADPKLDELRKSHGAATAHLNRVVDVEVERLKAALDASDQAAFEASLDRAADAFRAEREWDATLGKALGEPPGIPVDEQVKEYRALLARLSVEEHGQSRSTTAPVGPGDPPRE